MKNYTRPSKEDVKHAIHKIAQAQEKPKPRVSPEMREEYRRTKRFVITLENDNYDRVIAFPAEDGEWYRLGDMSALIYACELGPRAGKKVKLHVDTDKSVELFDYVVHLHDIKVFIETMGKVGLTEYELFQDKVYIFKLKKKYTKDDRRKLIRQATAARDELKNLVVTKALFPKFYGRLVQILPVFYAKAKKMDPFTQKHIGDRMIDNLLKINSAYVDITRGKLEAGPGMRAIADVCDTIMKEILLLVDLRVLDMTAGTRLGGEIDELKRLAIKAANKEDEA